MSEQKNVLLRFTRRGWYVACQWFDGSVDFRTGRDIGPSTPKTLWYGPKPTARQAVDGALW